MKRLVLPILFVANEIRGAVLAGPLALDAFRHNPAVVGAGFLLILKFALVAWWLRRMWRLFLKRTA